MQKVKAQLTIAEITRHGNVYRVRCSADDALPHVRAGQFAHIKVPGKDLRRPICVYRSGVRDITFIIARIGGGTDAFLSQRAGARFDALLPLGNGFPVPAGAKNAVILGGGTGCAPLLKIAEDYPSLEVTALLGFPNSEVKGVYGDDFDRVCKTVLYCTDDGSCGYRGYPTDLLERVSPDVVYVCGATGMVKTAREYCLRRGVLGYASMEQRMGCGVGACLVCSVPVDVNGERRLLRACADGPVFDIRELVL